jgi:hypothetical protein
MMCRPGKRLILICAETAAQRRRLARAAVDQGHRHGGAVRCVDLSGEGGLVLDSLPVQGLEPVRFDPGAFAQELWGQLAPVLQPWLTLLELPEPENPGPPWPLPGLADGLRCLFLAQQWHALDAAAGADTDAQLVVLMPPLPQSLEILRLARRGPDLLQEQWLPLLAWWDDTRQRLAQFELVLRLRLPAAKGLRLPQVWHRRLQGLADQLAAAQGTEVLLAMHLDAEDLPMLESRLVSLALAGLPGVRLWLQAARADGALHQLRSRLGLPVLLERAGEAVGFGPWLEQPLQADPVRWQAGEAGHRCRVFVPGVQRQGLQVRRLDDRLLLQASGQRLELPLPAACSQLDCCAARVAAPWVELDFR